MQGVWISQAWWASFRDLAREEAEAYIYKRVKKKITLNRSSNVSSLFNLQSALLIEILPSLYKETEGICLYLAESGARVHILSLDKVSESQPSWKSSCLWPWVPINLHLQKEQAFSLCPFLRAILCPLVPCLTPSYSAARAFLMRPSSKWYVFKCRLRGDIFPKIICHKMMGFYGQ